MGKLRMKIYFYENVYVSLRMSLNFYFNSTFDSPSTLTITFRIGSNLWIQFHPLVRVKVTDKLIFLLFVINSR